MNEQEQQLQRIEMSIEEAKKRIEDAAALDRLYKNEDFRRIFLDGYFGDEASRVVLLKADPEMQGKVQQRDCMNIIDAIGQLRQFFAKVFGLGTMAENSLKNDENTRTEILEEGLDTGLAPLDGEAIQ